MSELLTENAVRLTETAADRDTAIRRCGEVLVEIGAATPDYVDAMLEREKSISTYVGEGVAIPHGTVASKSAITRDALAVLRFPDGVDWGGSEVRVCVAIAARGEGHVELLSALAEVLMDPDSAERLREATDAQTVLNLLESIGKDSAV
ncbi:PTS sugar transporter subunit IIA [Stackebrandtia nassauensis]|uniref:Mannitol-specific phosphotransferase enzyme IIA component n=1 Tax=Stackebrandtia nassauensis (strain DSM 44728 / CIP 108903 / NRRL B-16338 / NBRC 102104 / LLR-40K-21) TaxID=446470 RepID=D3Q1X1_STANL|nr:PTS sugar transporter subunit IIA [Stackebrandtia nassauensis]ADD41838.1 phosphoenolpyruvate-dependent sugar phosphotransferase system EIIA 2 [Stackebrandtia nassauensis DSM 44728]